MSVSPLVMRCTERAGTTVLQIGGALVEGNTRPLERRIALLLTQVRHPLIIDLSQVHECDSVGAAVLAGAGRAASPATSVRLTGINDAVQHALRTTGVLRNVQAFGTVGGAIRADRMDVIEPE